MKILMKQYLAGTIITGTLLASLLFSSAAAFAAPADGGSTVPDTAAYGTASETAADSYAAEGEYIFPTSSGSLLYDGHFEGMTREKLRLGRNEIYARHGRRFNDPALQQYFDARSWYHGTIAPEAFDESCLNTWEKRNIQLIMNAEQGPFTSIGGVDTVAARGAARAEEHYVPLSADELRAFNNQFIPYNGFFTCVYNNPLEISWANVFYDGVEGDIQDYNAAVRAYEAATGEEVFTDITAVPLSVIEDFVRKTTGTEYSRAQKPLAWVWLPDLQAYAFQHGDTNRRDITFTSGEYSGDTLTLHFLSSGAETDYETLPFSAFLIKNGSGGWYFHSCRPD